VGWSPRSLRMCIGWHCVGGIVDKVAQTGHAALQAHARRHRRARCVRCTPAQAIMCSCLCCCSADAAAAPVPAGMRLQTRPGRHASWGQAFAALPIQSSLQIQRPGSPACRKGQYLQRLNVANLLPACRRGLSTPATQCQHLLLDMCAHSGAGVPGLHHSTPLPMVCSINNDTR
jgi:hypothetical protein